MREILSRRRPTEDWAPRHEGPDDLHCGEYRFIDIYFTFGVIAITAGVGAPLTIVAARTAVQR
jgi:hypothetical protein